MSALRGQEGIRSKREKECGRIGPDQRIIEVLKVSGGGSRPSKGEL